MHRLPAVLLAVAGLGCAVPQAIHYKDLEKQRFTRVRLRPDGGTKLYSAGYIMTPPTLPVGSPATVTMYSSQQVNVSIHGVPYTMYPIGANFATNDESIAAFLKKYFVDRKEDIKLDALGPAEHKEAVEKGNWILQMTKEQVYTALGPPAFIDDNIPAVNMDYEAIMKSGKWTYPNLWALFPFYIQFLFGNDGKLLHAL